MYSLNRAQVMGNLTRDPEMRYTPNGQAVCNFSVATNRRWKDKDGNNQEQTEFHNVVAWGKLAEFSSQWLHKGNRVYVEGRLQTRNWEGQDGAKRNRTEIVVENFIPLTPKGYSGVSEGTDSTPIPADIEEFPIKDESADKTKTTEKPAEKKSEKKKEDLPPVASAEGALRQEELEEINLDEIPF